MKKHTAIRFLFLLLSLSVTVFTAVSGCRLHPDEGSVSPDSTMENSLLVNELSGSLLRFRVLANSDSPSDQAQKQAVSKSITTLLAPALQTAATKEEAVSLIRQSIPFLSAYASCLTQEDGTGYEVSLQLGKHLFPYKTYGEYRFPAGSYDTLLVTLGTGLGSNWWCLAYPPLCFTGDCFVEVPETSEASLQRILPPEAYEAICPEDDTPEKENITFTFGLFSLFHHLFDG